MEFNGFPKSTLTFLASLAKNNRRDWFAEHKQEYEESILQPSLAFISAIRAPLAKVAPKLSAIPSKSGGSLMRIYKDTRFSKDKTPYKTNIGIQFRHQAGKDVHAPGVYVHIACDEMFCGVGLWRPDGPVLQQIREFVDGNPEDWNEGFHNKKYKRTFTPYEDSLKTMPRGFPSDHPNAADLKLKSFLGMVPLHQKEIQSADLVERIVELTKIARPMMKTLCDAVSQPY
ncbi:DUF2461 domain-containing protein [Pirellulaceae bacterium SH449]